MVGRARRVGVVVAIVVAVCATTALGIYLGRDSPRVDEQKREAPIASCEADAQCVGPRHAQAAAVACKADIEDLAGYGVRWVDRASAMPHFRRFAWRDRAAGVLTVSGDDAEFANAAGAYQPVNYECDFDPVTGKALNARVRQGRLP